MKNNPFLSGLFTFLLSLALLLPTLGGGVQAQENDPSAEVLALMEGMTPEERVGQLFLISFDGTSVADETQIAALLDQYSVGGVVLRADRGNFAVENLSGLQQLISDLQRKTWDVSRVDRLDPVSGETVRPEYIPLWVGISLEEDGIALEHSLTGLSPLPSPMAIGATWEPELATSVGEVLGSELAALGVNMYMGPSLDVLVNPDPANSGDMGTRSFGGSAYWVSQMGGAFIRGLHTGSDGQLLVVAKHFPGRGSADRSPSEEMATVRKTLDELKDVELAPFSAAVGSADGADALLIAHIRYEGFQGNIRPTTRPLSLDEKSLSQIFTLSPFAEWRATGGLTISDDLGSRAIHDFYAPGDQDFFANLIARDAFLAGNDLLYMGNILSSDAADSYTTVVRTLDFFTQKYREDPAFAARVDAALIRILTQKLSVYSSFNFYTVNNSHSTLAEVGENQQATFEIAQRAATLINPNIGDLDAILPEPPGVDERIVFITDTQATSQCALCGVDLNLERTSLSDAVLRLYGLGGGEEVLETNLSMYTFEDLLSLSQVAEEPPPLEYSLQQADWVVISLASDQKLDSLRQFLVDFQPVLREKKVILFSFTAPYLLDATDISKFTAYYGLYSYAPPFLDVAARLLFKELTPEGASPVNITGIGYDLSAMIEPDPDQLLTLRLALPPEAPDLSEMESATVPAPTMIPMFEVGDTLGVRTGIILDRNGNPVPDGTVVIYSLTMGGGNGIDEQIEAQTVGGTASADFQLSETGLLDIRVTSGEAIVSETLRLDISDEGIAAAITIIPPALEGESTSTPAFTPTPSQTPSIYVDVETGKLRFGAWAFTFLMWILGAALAYVAGERIESSRWGIRWALTTLLGGLVAYNYLALSLPGSKSLLAGGMLSVIVFVLLAELLGWLFGWLWLRRTLE